ncbi:MAG: HAMP domain-containing protein [Cohaesibacteraceae bacterium]|nr:HAMP domain-containing protein [Cohaesibacteraceae bacterium]MBL4876066.1 HAMP domain-containing protein [Cohaesibacteraceae bacterium]
MNLIGAELEGIAERDLPMTAAITEITTNQLEQVIHFERAIRFGEELASGQDDHGALKKSIEQFNKLTHLIEPEIQAAEILVEHALVSATALETKEFKHVLKLLNKIEGEDVTYDAQANRTFVLLKAGDISQVQIKLKAISTVQKQLDLELNSLLIEIENFTETAAKTAEAHAKFALKLIFIISGLALIIGIVTSLWLVRRSILRPLNAVVTGLDALNANNMNVDVPVYHDDEIGAVAMAYRTFKTTMIRARELEEEQQLQKRKSNENQRKLLLDMADNFDARVGEVVKHVGSSADTLKETAGAMNNIAKQTSERAVAVAAAT